MERKLIVTLLQKNIQELAMITEGFMEMNEYPAVIIQLARQKTKDVLDYIDQLEEMKETIQASVTPVIEPAVITEITEQIVEQEEIIIEEQVIEEESLPIIEEDIEIEGGELEEKETIEEEDSEEINNLQEEEEIVVEEPEIEEEIEDVVEEIEEEDSIEEIIEEEVVEIEENNEKVSFTAESHKVTLNERTTILTSEKNENTIADAHTNRKIDDIRQAISIGDRFRFQRELFEGNGELMNKTLSKLNDMKDFEAAIAFLQSKFKWDEEDETVESFYQIVKRRFL